MTVKLNKRAYSSQTLANNIYQLVNDEERQKGRSNRWRKLQLKETDKSLQPISKIAGMDQNKRQGKASI